MLAPAQQTQFVCEDFTNILAHIKLYKCKRPESNAADTLRHSTTSVYKSVMRGEGGRPDIAWSAHTYRIRQVAKQGTRARSGPQLSMFLQLAGNGCEKTLLAGNFINIRTCRAGWGSLVTIGERNISSSMVVEAASS